MKRFNKCCSYPKDFRLVIDILQIICLNIIHFGMEFTGIYNSDNGTGILTGEYVWYMIVNTTGFLVQLIALLKSMGFNFTGHCQRFYYGTCCLTLIFVATIVTCLSWAQQPDCEPESKKDKEPKKDCSSGNQRMSSAKFGWEIGMFCMSCVSSFLFLYAFSLTCCPRKTNPTAATEEEGPSDGTGLGEIQSVEKPKPRENDNANLEADKEKARFPWASSSATTKTEIPF